MFVLSPRLPAARIRAARTQKRSSRNEAPGPTESRGCHPLACRLPLVLRDPASSDDGARTATCLNISRAKTSRGAEHQADIAAAEPERVGSRHVDPLGLGYVGHMTHAALVVGMIEVDGGR